MATEHLFAQVFCEHCGFTLPVPIYCHNRFCIVCGNHRNRLIRWKLTTFIRSKIPRKYDSYKFLTLTIKNNPDLILMTDELIKSFRRLRSRAIWKKHVRGGACIVEVKPGKEGWHVHLHIVIESSFIPFKLLLAEWTAVSSGTGVYIKKLHSSQVVSYLTKYLTKEQATTAEQEYMTVVLKGKRLFQPFGSWYSPIQTMKKLSFDCPACERSSWAFGNHNTWFNSCSLEHVRDIREPERIPSFDPTTQTSLIPEMGFITTIHD